jgi:endonuclease-8
VPEGDTIFRTAATLRRAIAGHRLARLEIRRDPRGRRGPAPGTEITAVEPKGKHLLVRFADGHVLHTHMQMTGVWHVYAPGARWRRPAHSARVVLRTDDGTTAVCFSAPVVELRREGDVRDRATRAARMLERLGPDLCAADVDLDAITARIAGLDPATQLGVVLLDQRVAAGVGNVFKSEVCWAERVSPFAPIGALDDPTRRRIYATAQRQLARNLGSGRRTTHGNGLAVYGRAGKPCPRCRSAIRRAADASGRATYWCSHCQATTSSITTVSATTASPSGGNKKRYTSAAIAPPTSGATRNSQT